jgi:magnesium chelatase family protein
MYAVPEFRREALEALRQPIETGRVTVARANAHVVYPARFQLLAAMNPCRCGYLADAGAACSRAPKCGDDYQAKISGPMLDRFDLVVEVPAVNPNDLSLPSPGETSAEVAARVGTARERQRTRGEEIGASRSQLNAAIDGKVLEETATPDDAGRKLLSEAVSAFGLTARGYHRVLRVGRTLADLDGSERVSRVHIAEALSYRRIRPGHGHISQTALSS